LRRTPLCAIELSLSHPFEQLLYCIELSQLVDVVSDKGEQKNAEWMDDWWRGIRDGPLYCECMSCWRVSIDDLEMEKK
jgi:hypothetical protein